MLLPQWSEPPTSQIDTFAQRKRQGDYFERSQLSKLAKTEPHELNFPSKYGLMLMSYAVVVMPRYTVHQEKTFQP